MTAGIIILDGPDGSGKTTLARHLCATVKDAVYVHLSAPARGQAWQEHRAALLRIIAEYRQGRLVVVDRHFLSEAVYGAVYRGGSEYPFAARHVDRLLYRFGALRVVCCPPVEHVVQTHARLMKERGEMYADRMDKVAKLYLALWEGRPGSDVLNYLDHLIVAGGVNDQLGWAKYDVTMDGVDLPKTGERFLTELAQLAATVPCIYDTTDNLTGWARKQAVLLVGDRCSNSEEWPFLSNAGSSLYLATVLNRLGADEARVCMINANGPGGEKLLRQKQVRCGRTVAMGREAERALELFRIPYHAKVRHPQHAARFSRNDNSYELELGAAMAGMAGVA